MKQLSSHKSRLQRKTATKLTIVCLLFILTFIAKETKFTAMLSAVLSSESVFEAIFSAFDNMSEMFDIQTTNRYLEITLQNCIAGFAILMGLALKLIKDREMKNTNDFVVWSVAAILFAMCTAAKICSPALLVYFALAKSIFDFITTVIDEEIVSEIKFKIKQKNTKVTKRTPEMLRKQHCEEKVLDTMIPYRRRQETTVAKRWFFVV